MKALILLHLVTAQLGLLLLVLRFVQPLMQVMHLVHYLLVFLEVVGLLCHLGAVDLATELREALLDVIMLSLEVFGMLFFRGEGVVIINLGFLNSLLCQPLNVVSLLLIVTHFDLIDIIVEDALRFQFFHLFQFLLVPLHVILILFNQVFHGIFAGLVLQPSLFEEDTFLLVLGLLLGLLSLPEGHLLVDVEVLH